MHMRQSGDLYHHTTFSAASGSQRSNNVVFVTSKPSATSDAYESTLWLIDSTDPNSTPAQMTYGGAVSSACLSPDGDQIAFLSRCADQQHPSVHILRVNGGEARPLQGLDTLQVESILQWSPDGCRLLATAKTPWAEDDRDDVSHSARPIVTRHLPYKLDGVGATAGFRTHLYAIEVDDTGPPQPLISGDFDVKSAAWSPDGERLAFAATASTKQRHPVNLHLLESDGSRRQLTDHMAAITGLAWSPSGELLAFTGSEHPGDSVNQLFFWHADARMSKIDEILHLEGGDIAWEPDSAHVSVRVHHQGSIQIARVTPETGAWALVDLGDTQVGPLTACGTGLAFPMTSFEQLDDLYYIRWDGQAVAYRLTKFNEDLSRSLDVQCTKRQFQVPNGDAGKETIDAWLLTPRNVTKDLPLLVDLHGGPHSVALMDFASHVYAYLLLARGWAVVLPNPVGSTGYGTEFYQRLRGRWGVLDLPQVEAVIGSLQEDGTANGLAVCAGKSYGGYLSAWAIAHSQRFAAAVISAPVADMASHAGTSDTGYYVTPFAMRAEPSEDPGRYERLSPVSYFDAVSRPVLLLNGQDDQRCPAGQVEQLFACLARAGEVDATLVVYPGGTHALAGTGRPSHRHDYHCRIVDFVEANRASAPRDPFSRS